MESNNTADIQKTIAYVQQKKGNNKVYIQGLISVAVFGVSLVIALFIYIPYIQGIQATTKQADTVLVDVAALQTKYKTINEYDRSTLDQQLASADHFIPDDIRVAQLATFINQNAKKFNLTVSRLGINEGKAEVKQSVASDEQSKLLGSAKDEKKIFLGRVEGPFSFSGTRDNIFSFLDYLVTGGYATNFDQVTITSGVTNSDWSVNFFAVYYYLQPIVGVEPGRQLIQIQKDALVPLNVDTNVVPGVSITPNATDTVSPTPSETATVSPTDSTPVVP